MQISRREFLELSGISALGALIKPLNESVSSGKIDREYRDIVVVGGGIAGLTAGWFLRKEDVLILERSERAGGRVVGKKMHGFSVALGAEYLGPPQGAWGRLVRETGLKPVEIPAPMDAIFRDGRIFSGEEGVAHSLISSSSLKDYNRFGQRMENAALAYDEMDDFDPESVLGKLDDISARDWFVQEKVPMAIYDAYNVSCRGLFGANLAEVSALSVIPEFGFDFEDFEPYSEKPPAGGTSGGEHSGAYSFVHGIAELTDALAAELDTKFLSGCEVTLIERVGKAFNIQYRRKDSSLFKVNAEAVILAVPAPVILRIAQNVLSSEQKAILGKMPYAPYLTAAIVTKEPLFNLAFDLAMPDGLFLTDLYDSTWIERAYDPEMRKNQTWIATAYVAGQSYLDAQILRLSDTEIMKRLFRDLQDVAPDIEKKVTEYSIQTFPYAYPVMVPGAYKRIARLQETSGTGGVYFAGDYLAYPTFEDAADSGQDAARDCLEN